MAQIIIVIMMILLQTAKQGCLLKRKWAVQILLGHLVTLSFFNKI
jgi:hypothetical protein